MDHPFHPQHPLVLEYSNRTQDIVFCKGCNSGCESFNYYYACDACEFYLDLECALRKPTLKDPCHQHELAYYERVKYIRCRICGYCCSYDLYRCLGCNFSVHRDCLPLPLFVQEDNECHIHPLILCDKVAGRVCGVCKLETKPRHSGAYYCEECDFVAHIECAVSKGTKPEYSHCLKKKIDTVNHAIDKAKSLVEEYQKVTQRKMASLDVLEKLKSGWGETFQEEEEDFLQIK